MARTGSAALAKMSAARRRELELDDYQIPQQTIQPVRGLSMGAAPAAAAPASMPAPIAPIEAPWFKPVQGFGTMAPAPVPAPVPAPTGRWEGSGDNIQWIEDKGKLPVNKGSVFGTSETTYSGDNETTRVTSTPDYTAPLPPGYQWYTKYTPGGDAGDAQEGESFAARPQDFNDPIFGALIKAGMGMLLGGAASGYLGAPTGGGTSGAVDSAALGLDVGSATGNGAFLGEGVMSGIPSWDMAAIPAITSNPAAALDAYTAANPVTMAEVMQTMPQISLPAAAPVTGLTMTDGAFLGEAPWSPTPAAAPAAAPAPSLDAGGGGGGSIARPADQIRMLEANGLTPSDIIVGSPELAQAGGLTGVGGTLGASPFDSIRDTIKPLQDWIKANPTLARGGAALLGGLFGGTGGLNPTSARPGTTYTGPARTWGGGLQMGIQPGQRPAWSASPVTQAPGAITPLTGLRMSGAGRYFGG